MTTPTPPLPEGFARLERRLETLRSLHAMGRLTSEQYQEEVQNLTVADDQGTRWWLAGESGAWNRWNGRSWERGQPASEQGTAQKPAKNESGTRKPRIGLAAGLGCVGLVAACLTASGVFLGGGYAEYQATPKIVEGVRTSAAAAAPLALSSDQQRVREDLGEPEAFMILFYEEPLEDGSVGDVRTETWTYYTQGVEYTFINGEKVGQDDIEVEIDGLAPVPYQPERFLAYMNLEEVLAAAGLDSFLVVPLEKELVRDGEVYYADQLAFGLQDNELRYIEALALDIEG